MLPLWTKMQVTIFILPVLSATMDIRKKWHSFFDETMPVTYEPYVVLDTAQLFINKKSQKGGKAGIFIPKYLRQTDGHTNSMSQRQEKMYAPLIWSEMVLWWFLWHHQATRYIGISLSICLFIYPSVTLCVCWHHIRSNWVVKYFL